MGGLSVRPRFLCARAREVAKVTEQDSETTEGETQSTSKKATNETQESFSSRKIYVWKIQGGRRMFSNGLAQGLPDAALVAITLCLTLTLAVVSVVDFRTLRIPDALSLPLILAGLSLAVTVPQVYPADYFIGAIAAFALFAGIGESYFRMRGIDGLGLGDAKLFAAAGAWLGWQNLPMVLMIAAFGGLAQAVLTRLAHRDTQLAFGPWIAFGFWAVWMMQWAQLE